MPPKKDWDEDSSEEDSSTGPEAPQVVAGRRKFDDEEEDDSDVLDSWDAAEDSEVEREKARKASEAKAKAEAAANASKKTRAERIAQHEAERKAAKEAAEEDESSDDETEQQKRERLRREQKEADLKHAEDLFTDISPGTTTSRRGNTAAAAAVVVDPANPNHKVDLGSLPLFNPKTKTQLEALGKTIAPLIGQHQKMPHYVAFLQDVLKNITKELPSDQVKKLASTLTAVSNEKMKAEKASEKTGRKKGKAKTSLVTTRNNVEDVQVYQHDDFRDDDFM